MSDESRTRASMFTLLLYQLFLVLILATPQAVLSVIFGGCPTIECSFLYHRTTDFPQSFSIEYWINHDLGSLDMYGELSIFDGGATHLYHWSYIEFNASSSSISAASVNTGGGKAEYKISVGNESASLFELEPNRWYHLCVVYEANSAFGRLSVFVDGESSLNVQMAPFNISGVGAFVVGQLAESMFPVMTPMADVQVSFVGLMQ